VGGACRKHEVHEKCLKNLDGKPFGRSRLRREDNIKMELRLRCCGLGSRGLG